MSSTPVAAGTRIEWDDVPRHVRAAVEQELGSPITEAVTQHGGFSPGAAVRVICRSGRRAFIKAVGLALNPESPGLHRAEIRAMSLLRVGVPAPRLLASYDDGDWVALVLEDIDGRRPSLPWQASDVELMSTALGQLARTTAPDSMRPFRETMQFLDSWDKIAADPADIDSVLLDRLPEMLAAQSLARQVSHGDTLVHFDARADNVLIRDDRAVLLDWAWASRGAPWIDTLVIALDFTVQGGPDPDAFLRRSEATRDVPAAQLRSLIVSLLGMFADRSRQPAPPGLPTLRGWQAHCRDRTLRWVDEGAVWS